MDQHVYLCMIQKQHMYALKHIIQYIQGTLDFGSHIYPSSVNTLITYTDAHWGGCLGIRRSTSRYCVYLCTTSCLGLPNDGLHSLVLKPNIMVANVVSKSCWFRNLILELHYLISKATLVYCDNVSVVYLSVQPRSTSTHIGHWYGYSVRAWLS